MNASASNVCGTIINGSKYITVGNGGDVPMPIINPGDDISVYPNPVSGFLNISNTDAGELSNVTIINLQTGKEVYSTACLKTSEAINFQTFPNGTYLLRYSINNIVKTQKIIKR